MPEDLKSENSLEKLQERLRRAQEKLQEHFDLERQLVQNWREQKVSHVKSEEIIAESKEAQGDLKEKIENLTKNIQKQITKEEEKQKPAPEVTPKKWPGKKSTNLARRDFLKIAGLAAAGGAVQLSSTAGIFWFLRKLFKKKSRQEEIREIKEILGIKIPNFIHEESLNSKEALIPDNIIELIDQAVSELEKREAGFTITQEPIPGTNPPQFKDKLNSNVLIATVNLSDPSTGIKFAKLNPKEEVVEENTEGEPGDEEEYQVDVTEGTGIGRGYNVTIPKEHEALAVRQAIYMRHKLHEEPKPTEAVNSPYNPDLNVPLVRHEGFKYLVTLLINAKEELRKKGVKSRFDKKKDVAPDIPLEITLMLTIVEQVDPGIFNKESKKIAKQYDITQAESDIHAMKSLAKRAFTKVGQTRKYAQRYARSGVGAAGLFQLMPATYHSLAGIEVDTRGNITKVSDPLYPKADLNTNFLEGVTIDHLNAAQAAVMLLDSDLFTAGRNLREGRLKNASELGKFLAASYNAGAPSVKKTIEKYGDDWASNMPDDETKIYIRKYVALEALFNNQDKPLPELPGVAKDKTIDDRNRSSVPKLEDVPSELRGSPASLRKQNDTIDKQRIERIAHMPRLAELVKAGKLVSLPDIPGLITVNPTKSGIEDPRRRYCLPEVAKFLINMANASKKFNPNFEPLMINSAVRPEDVQQALRKKNANATSKSPHTTGIAVDIAYNANSAGYKGMSQAQMEWTQAYLIQMEKKGLIEVTQERGQTVFHIAVFQDYLNPRNK